MLTWVDWVVIGAPAVLGVIAAIISFRPPTRTYHWGVGAIVLVLGVGSAGVSLYQLQQTRRANAEQQQRDAKEKRNLQSKIEALNAEVGELSRKSIPALIGDLQGLKPRPKPRPDLRLHLVYPEYPAILIDNAPDAGVAEQPKYQAMLFDLDNPTDLLKIPVFMGDFIRPGRSMGPNEFMELPAVVATVKMGDRIFGSVFVSCPDCVVDRAYWLFVKVGEGGWYAEQNGPPRVVDPKAVQHLIKYFDSEVDQIAPPHGRIPIK